MSGTDALSVVIPWQAGEPNREIALGAILGMWAACHPLAEVVVGELAADEPWCKATAVRRGLDQTSRDLLLVADADVWLADGDALDLALGALRSADVGWSVPHLNVVRFSAETTARWASGEISEPDGQRRQQSPYQGWLGGGMVALARSTYDLCPLDPRFVGWGQEDEAWALLLTGVEGPPWRGTSDLWHLFHPKPQRSDRRRGSAESVKLLKRYEECECDPDELLELVGEAL